MNHANITLIALFFWMGAVTSLLHRLDKKINALADVDEAKRQISRVAMVNHDQTCTCVGCRFMNDDEWWAKKRGHKDV